MSNNNYEFKKLKEEAKRYELSNKFAEKLANIANEQCDELDKYKKEQEGKVN